MDINRCEFAVSLTAFFPDGSTEEFIVRQAEGDQESARYRIWHEFKNIGDKFGVEYVTTTIIPASSGAGIC